MEKTEGTLSLIAANAVTAACAVLLHWPLYTLLWPFWIQSIIIGWYSGRRILALTHFSTENFEINHHPVPPTRATQVKTVTFFAVHYGFFHLVYLGFILGLAPAFGWVDRLAVAGAAVAFTLSHHSSFHRNLEADRTGSPNIGTLMFLPYARIIPMHLTIILGGKGGADSTAAILIFCALKTGADVLMQHVEHALIRHSAEPSAP